MTKFEEELSSLPVSKSTNYAEYWNKAQLLTAFKDWQPQQSLPVVPECVAEWYEDKKNKLEFAVYNINTLIDKKSFNDLTKIEKWFEGVENKPIETIFKMKDGYTVEKPQLFYLKNKLTGLWLMRYEIVDKVYPYDHTSDIRNRDTFTQQEIDSMETGSYELVPVEDGE
ncbi:DUF1642 domain-containing protein [Lactococcus lactis]|uniref:DUF1642 domain-containing protein n=1 Tax=Lactococcus lactis TaxID=1358 RepID=A0ABD5GQH7_9LACT|nr:DUF1642 domain-containing protein [Lactococcus lactis]MDV2619473.1 DUF1642 domain-containing protein [Lactococcus lactis]